MGKVKLREGSLAAPLVTHHDHLEDECVLGQDPEHVDDAGHHPGLHRGQP